MSDDSTALSQPWLGTSRQRAWSGWPLLALCLAVPCLWLLLPQPAVPVALATAGAAALLQRRNRGRSATALIVVATLTLLGELVAALLPPPGPPRVPRIAARPATSEGRLRSAPLYPGLLADGGLSPMRWVLRRRRAYVLDADLGWIPGPEQELRTQVGTRECVLHTDAHGARVGLPPRPGARALLLFGCSVSFGWGVADDQPFGHVVAQDSEGALFDVNLGVPSGGPHEAYAFVAAERERAVVPPAGVGAAVLTVLPHHVFRVVGGYKNSGESPRYELEGGRLVRHGQHRVAFSNLIMLPRWWFFQKQLHKSLLLGRLWDEGQRAYDLRLQTETVADPTYACELTAELVRATRELIDKRYGAPTLVLLMPEWDDLRGVLKRALIARGVVPLDLAERLPELRELVVEGDPDRHPSAEGHRRIARLVEEWLASSGVVPDASLRVADAGAR